MAKNWYKYIEMQDSNVRKEYIEPFLNESRLPLKLRIKELLILITKRLGIYGFLKSIKDRIANIKEKISDSCRVV